MHSLTPTLLSLLSFTSLSTAWGTLGHATVAAIAENYLTSQAQKYVGSILGDGVTMASIASWADEFRETKAGHFSAPFHFVDARDSPPQTCSVSPTRDCSKNNCILTAIANYTARLTSPSFSFTPTDQQESLMFLIHFLGDVTQPLHDEALRRGGNGIPVTWDGKETNLHHAWDTQMVEAAAGGENSTDVLAAFTQKLVQAIDEGGIWAGQKAGWIDCVDFSRASECALEWAQDANQWNCEIVLVGDENGQELSGDYFVAAQPVIEVQLAKGGYRLAAFLNGVAATAAVVEKEVGGQVVLEL